MQAPVEFCNLPRADVEVRNVPDRLRGTAGRMWADLLVVSRNFGKTRRPRAQTCSSHSKDKASCRLHMKDLGKGVPCNEGSQRGSHFAEESFPIRLAAIVLFCEPVTKVPESPSAFV